MRAFTNYLGQLRLYSLVDLILLIFALGGGKGDFLGLIFLHIGFLTYLENIHSHIYRLKVNKHIPYVLTVCGMFFYARIESFLYIIFSYIYTKKNNKIGYLGPICRGLQNFFITAGIVGYSSYVPYLVGILFTVRNMLGDFRDIEKDTKENMKTIPIVFGFKKSIKNVHLLAVMGTSIIWWSLSTVSIVWLILVICIQIKTYDLTPR